MQVVSASYRYRSELTGCRFEIVTNSHEQSVSCLTVEWFWVMLPAVIEWNPRYNAAAIVPANDTLQRLPSSPVVATHPRIELTADVSTQTAAVSSTVKYTIIASKAQKVVHFIRSFMFKYNIVDGSLPMLHLCIYHFGLLCSASTSIQRLHRYSTR